MTTEANQEIGTPEDSAAETAAFEASFEGVAQPAALTTAEQAPVTPELVVSTDAEPEAKPEAAPTAPSPKAEAPDYGAEIRKLNGRIGALNDQLHQALKSKEADGKPAALTTRELTRMKAEYPELASLLEQDLAESLANVSGQAPDPKAIEDLVSSRVQREIAVLREDAVTDRHENWAKDLWADQPGGTRTTEYTAWLKTMTESEVATFESSKSPAFVNRKLDQFYDWKSKASKAEEVKQNRLKGALTPQGTARSGPRTISEDEAAQKAFDAEFNQ